jgi:hypothetical protein
MNSPLTTAQLGQTLFPHLTQSDLDFKTLCNVLVFWDLELGKVPWQQFREDKTKVAEGVSQQVSVRLHVAL